jgi:predicted ArsR family transcriptional regulator
LSQQDVLEALEKKKKATAEEIAKMLEISMDAVRKSLSRLFRTKEVEKIRMTKEEVAENNKQFTGRHFVWMIKRH